LSSLRDRGAANPPSRSLALSTLLASAKQSIGNTHVCASTLPVARHAVQLGVA
jgi:hypothetical protein